MSLDIALFSSLLIVSCAIIPPSTATAGVLYAPLALWPYPHNVTLPPSLGPHLVPRDLSSGIEGDRYRSAAFEGCVKADVLKARLLQALSGRTTYRATLRVFDETPYARRDAACNTNRCCDDADCAGEAQRGRGEEEGERESALTLTLFLTLKETQGGKGWNTKERERESA